MTVSYRVSLKKSAERELRALSKEILSKVVARIKALAESPRPTGCEKLTGEDRYRLRQGDYRVVYSVDDEQQTVEIVKIGHRKEVYR